MPRLRPPVSSHLSGVVADQGGVLTRAQALGAGMSPEQIRRTVSREWQPSAHAGVYVASNGAIDYRTRCWAALLHAGAGSALGLSSAAWTWGLVDEPPRLVHVMVPAARRPARQEGVRFHIRVHLAERVHPARRPPVVRLEETVLDLVDQPSCTEGDAVGIVLDATQRRLTTAGRLADALASRKKIRHRFLLLDLLDDAAAGVASALEHRYLHRVERAHGLPRGQRNYQERTPSGSRYRDVRYPEFAACVELDGAATHPNWLRELDHLRDNEVLVSEGTRTVRYGWRSVTSLACETAGQVGRLLAQGGWTGMPRRCGPECCADFP